MLDDFRSRQMTAGETFIGWTAVFDGVYIRRTFLWLRIGVRFGWGKFSFGNGRKAIEKAVLDNDHLDPDGPRVSAPSVVSTSCFEQHGGANEKRILLQLIDFAWNGCTGRSSRCQNIYIRLYNLGDLYRLAGGLQFEVGARKFWRRLDDDIQCRRQR
jgi:hypothetical protein